jgi:hypothetical protein
MMDTMSRILVGVSHAQRFQIAQNARMLIRASYVMMGIISLPQLILVLNVMLIVSAVIALNASNVKTVMSRVVARTALKPIAQLIFAQILDNCFFLSKMARIVDMLAMHRFAVMVWRLVGLVSMVTSNLAVHLQIVLNLDSW